MSKTTAPTFFISTAIFYVNGEPHLGGAYEMIWADVIARYQRALGKDVLFTTGVDEHGQKVYNAVKKTDEAPQDYVDRMSERFEKMAADVNISHDVWVRTTADSHKEKVQAILQKLYDAGDIYEETYRGFYSIRQEQFVTEKEQDEEGNWPELFGEVIEMEEPNYMFRLSKYQDWLIDHVTKNEDFIFPEFRRKEVLERLKEPLADLCITRPKERMPWGIEMPFDSDFVTYVWFDALLNYYTFGEKDGQSFWPCDGHVIGKDIMIPAHAIYWPIMLHAAGLPIFQRLFVHGWWLNRGAKISKSSGGPVAYEPYVEKFGIDGLRYYLMREAVAGQDADFSDERIAVRYGSELANTIGNLLQRTLNMIGRYRDGVVPAYAPTNVSDEEAELRSDAAVEEYRARMEDLQTHKALQAVIDLATAANQYVDRTAPFKLAKDDSPDAQKKLDVILAHLAETCRRLSILLGPFIPTSAAQMQEQMQLPDPQTAIELAVFGSTLTGHTIGKPSPLFPRIDDEKK